jgi:hypothetical protein
MSAKRRLGPFPFGGNVGFNASSRSRGYARERKGRQSHDRCGPESEITLAEVSAALELIKNCRCAVGNETALGDCHAHMSISFVSVNQSGSLALLDLGEESL